jgi:hypothetical protein
MKEFKIIKDFMGWAVSITDYSNHIESVKMGFGSKEDAEKYIEEEKQKIYKGSGVLGNAI